MESAGGSVTGARSLGSVAPQLVTSSGPAPHCGNSVGTESMSAPLFRTGCTQQSFCSLAFCDPGSRISSTSLADSHNRLDAVCCRR